MAARLIINPVQSKNRARPMAARLKKKNNKSRVKQEPRSAHGRAVNNNKSRVKQEPRSAHGRAVNKNRARPMAARLIRTSKFFKDYKLHSPLGLVQFCYPFKNLLVLIYSKLHSKSCDYWYKLSSLFTVSTGVSLFKSSTLLSNSCAYTQLPGSSIKKETKVSWIKTVHQ